MIMMREDIKHAHSRQQNTHAHPHHTHIQQTEHGIVLIAASLPAAGLVLHGRLLLLLLLHPLPPPSAFLLPTGVLCLQTTNDDASHVFDRRGGCHAVGCRG